MVGIGLVWRKHSECSSAKRERPDQNSIRRGTKNIGLGHWFLQSVVLSWHHVIVVSQIVSCWVIQWFVPIIVPTEIDSNKYVIPLTSSHLKPKVCTCWTYSSCMVPFTKRSGAWEPESSGLWLIWSTAEAYQTEFQPEFPWKLTVALIHNLI